MIATLAICLIPIHSPTISEQPIEKVYALSLMGKRAHSDADIRGPAGIALGVRTETALWERLWERAQCANAQLLNFQQEAGAPEEIRTPDPQIRSLVGPLVSLSSGTASL